jgi:hypothetical protein
MASENAADAAGDAAGQQGQASAAALQLQRDQFNYQKSLNEPFYKGSMPAYYQYLSAVTGQPQSYVDPNAPGAKTLTDQEIQAANIAAIKQQFPDWTDNMIAIGLKRGEGLPYQMGGTYYRDANGGISTEAPASAMKSTGVWTPTETPAYAWQQEQANKNNSRTLRALGRENSSYGMGEQFKTQQNLAANEYDKQLSRLSDLTNVARGGASTLTQGGNAYSTDAANNLINSGNNQANATLAGGMMQQNNLYNAISTGMGVLNTGLKAYNAGSWAQPSTYNANKPDGEFT